MSREIEPLLHEDAKWEKSSGRCARCCGCCCGPLGRLIWLGTLAFFLLSWFICEYENTQFWIAWTDDLAKQTSIAETKLGSIEYYKRGSAPYVLMVHGQMNGWDFCKVALAVDPWIAAGYGIICPSRAGYLRSPLAQHPVTSALQADLYAALLDDLAVDKVVVTGGSAGGPSMYDFGVRHPDRIVALIPLVAISGAKAETPDSPLYGVNERGEFPWRARMLSSILTDPTIERLMWWSMQDVGVAVESATVQMSRYTQEQREAEKLRIERNATLSKAVVEMTLEGAMPMHARWGGNLNDICVQTYLKLELEKIAVPTLIVHDEFAGGNGVGLENARRAKRLIPNSELIIVPDAWHIIWLAPTWGEVMAKQIAFAKAAAAWI